MTCPHCNAPLATGARFCGVCGKASISTASQFVPPTASDGLQMIGRDIAGRYRIVAKLGEGGMGAVYRAEQISLKRACAIKLLKPEVSGNPQLVRRFNAEAQVVAKLSHPNTVNIYDFGQDADGTLFIAMEYVDGTSLREALHAGPMSPRRALHIADQVASSLADAHAQTIVHRDLKPDNVMLQERGKQHDVARVLDFGIAKLRDDSRQSVAAMTQAGDMLGTPQYMAPEQIRGQAIDGRTDVYALGCMIYEMVTGRMPFEADTVLALLSKHLLDTVVAPTQRRPELNLPPQLDALVLGAMAKDPGGRPPTMDLYGEMIAHVLAGLPPEPTRQIPVSTPPAYSIAASGFGGTEAAMPAVGPAPTPYTPAPIAPIAQVAPTTPIAYGGPTPTPAPLPMPPAITAPGPARAGGNKTAIIAIAAIGGVVAIGLAAYLATSGGGGKHDTVAVADAHPRHDDRDPPAPDAQPAPRPPDPPPRDDGPLFGTIEDDPGPAFDLTAKPVEISLPAGAVFEIPLGFKPVPAPNAIVGADDRKVVLSFGATFKGSDDMQVLSRVFEKTFRCTFDGLFQVTSAGRTQVAARHHCTINKVPYRFVIVGYLNSGYRVALAIAAPTEIAKQRAFDDDMKAVVRDNVHLP